MKAIYIFLLLNFGLNASAQNWLDVGGGLSYNTYCIYGDSISGKLYVGGDFIYAGTDSVNHIASWDGMSWDSMGPGAQYYSGHVESIIRYKNDIIASGNFFSPMYDSWIGRWNGSQWFDIPNGPNNAFISSTIFDTLYLFGLFDSVGNIPSTGLAKWDGSSWYSSHFSCSNFSFIADGTWYQNRFYIGGNFWDTQSGCSDFAVLENDSLRKVGGINIANGLQVVKMIEFLGKLYIAGNFTTAPYNFGENIVCWDGSQFSSVGGGTDGFIRDMKVIDGNLYVVGAFQYAGSVQTQYIARWDGNNWHSVGGSTFNSCVTSIGELNDELYVGGCFTEVDGQPLKYIAKYSHPLADNEFETQHSINLFPNPVSNYLKLSFSESSTDPWITNILNSTGQLIHHQELPPGTKQLEISTTSWPAGLYLVQVQTEKGSVVRKVVKE